MLSSIAEVDIRPWSRLLRAVADETRARRDLRGFRSRVQPSHALPAAAPDDAARFIAWVERLLVDVRDGAQLLPVGVPSGWEGHNFEVYGVPTGATSSISFAVRWHGARPAVLWEQTTGADGPVALSSPVVAPHWFTSELTGEALWPQPLGDAIRQVCRKVG